MDITWHDNTCFTLRDKKGSLVINPHKGVKGIKAQIVLSSLKENGEVEGAEKVFDWPGEYEMKGIPISATQLSGEAGETLVFCFEIDGVKFCHLGTIGQSLTSEMVKEIGDVDVLMVNVGKGAGLSGKKVQEIIEAIEPRAIIPMGSDLSPETLKEIGADKIEAVDKFEIKGLSTFSDDKMLQIVLNKC